MSKLIRRASLPLRSRSGSVLILVVALLVLLALMGTAFISTTRNERGVAIQNNANTEADLLLQGLVNATAANTVGDLYGPSAGTSSVIYRPPLIDVGTAAATSTYNNFTAASQTLYLADRAPTQSGVNYQWSQLGWPLFATGTDATLGSIYQFDSPLVQPTTPTVAASIVLGPTTANPTAVAAKAAYISGYIIGSIVANGQSLPSITVGGTTVVAADADGDGIADSGLFKLPVSPVDGITYYGAIRVIDGNSAVNVNTAVSNTTDYAASPAPKATDAEGTIGGTAPVGFFASGVGLKSLLTDTSLTSSDDFPRAEYYLCNQQICPIEFVSNPTTSLTLNTPVTDYQTQRPDFVFSTWGDILSSQLGRRINNPGYFNISGTYAKFTPFSLNDAAALASGFCVKSSSSSNSDIETWLRYSLTNAATSLVHTSPYGVADYQNWYTNNFSFDAETATPLASPRMPVRSVLTTWNPVADYAPQHYVTRTVKVAGAPGATTVVKNQPLNGQMLPYDPDLYVSTYTAYAAGDFVKFKNPQISNPPYRCYQCLMAATANAPISAAGVRDYADWREEPWTETPTKANINTADFPTLWRAFYNVMADSSKSTTYVSNGDSIPPLPGTSTVVPANDATVVPVVAGGTEWGPFRDPSRTPATTTPLTACEMLQLRSAIAAVNAMDLRDSDDDVTSRNIPIFADPSVDQSTATPAFTATVFGCERQPFISVVSADYDPTSTTAGLTIELFNPTESDIDISNWQIATVARAAGGIITLANASTTLPAIPTGTKILAGKYVVLQSTAPVANFTVGGNDSTTVITVAGMESVVKPTATATELVILRPRKAGTATLPNPYTTGQTTPFDNAIDEGTIAAPNLAQMVPVDMIDLAGVMSPTGTAHQYEAYERPHDTPLSPTTDDFGWQFVYPGAYTATATTTSKQAGWNALTGAVPSFDGGVYTNKDPANPAVSTRSVNGAAAIFPYSAIQLANSSTLNNRTWVGKHLTNVAAGNVFPFASFARNGDMLKTPFIGAYIIHTGAGLAGSVVAINSITMDASQADAYTSLKAATSALATPQEILDEPVGRFVPLAAIDPALALSTYESKVVGSVTVAYDPYGWAAKIFDYLDVQVSNDDYLPNVDPRLADGSNVNNTVITYSSYSGTNPPKYPDVSTGVVAPDNNATSTVPVPVANQNSSTGFANGTFEQSVGKQGLININTAPAFVLAQLPGVTGAMATKIVSDRVANGPFRTIFDLNRVDGGAPNNTDCFYTAGNTYTFVDATTKDMLDHKVANDPGLAGGDFTPGTATLATTDGVRNDWEERTLMLTRISNLITTRSDTFTCYVELQGWRNAGTANATLAVQRRAAFILDRTNVTASNSKPQMFTVPNP